MLSFPSTKDIEFFISEQAQPLQELWEPKFGDWYYIPRHSKVHILTHHNTWFIGAPKRFVEHNVWLPRQGQLQAMLEERGYALAHLGDERVPPDFEGRLWNPEEPYIVLAEREPGDYVKGIGPTPSIALGRALIEVLKEE